MFYWVMQEIGSEVVAHGPYRTKSGRDNRFGQVFGGEVHKYNSASQDPEVAKQDFWADRIRSL